MDYEFEVSIDEPIIVDGETVIKVIKIQAENKVKLGLVGPHEVWREEIQFENN